MMSELEAWEPLADGGRECEPLEAEAAADGTALAWDVEGSRGGCLRLTADRIG